MPPGAVPTARSSVGCWCHRRRPSGCPTAPRRFGWTRSTPRQCTKGDRARLLGCGPYNPTGAQSLYGEALGVPTTIVETHHARHQLRTVAVRDRVVPPHSAADMTMPSWALFHLNRTLLGPRPVASALPVADGEAVVPASPHDAVLQRIVDALSGEYGPFLGHVRAALQRQLQMSGRDRVGIGALVGRDGCQARRGRYRLVSAKEQVLMPGSPAADVQGAEPSGRRARNHEQG